MISGFARGKVDIVLMRITDIFLTIPSLPLIIVLTAYVQSSGVFAAVAILSVTFWAGLARAIRAQMLTLTERDFVEAARVLGLSRRHIIFREMLPNLVPFIAIGFIGFFTNAIFAAVGLSLLGLLPLDSSNWGQMLNIAINGVGALYSTDTVAYLVAPIICIVLIQLAAVLCTRWLEDIFNPRIRAR
jgi:peptide/nickel transport system permease protein